MMVEQAKVVCDKCQKVWAVTQIKSLGDVHHLGERLDAGGLVPHGACPDCGGFCYLHRMVVMPVDATEGLDNDWQFFVLPITPALLTEILAKMDFVERLRQANRDIASVSYWAPWGAYYRLEAITEAEGTEEEPTEPELMPAGWLPRQDAEGARTDTERLEVQPGGVVWWSAVMYDMTIESRPIYRAFITKLLAELTGAPAPAEVPSA